jgi:protease-4
MDYKEHRGRTEGTMKQILLRLLAALGALVVLAAIAGGAVAVVVQAMRARVPGKTLLEVNLEQGLVEDVPPDPVAQVVLRDRPTLRGTVEALERAGDDPRVAGLVATLGAAPIGFAQTQELRDAVIAFRKKGKPAIAFAETFGEFGPGNGAYYLATAFDRIWLQPSGDVGLTGLLSETPFLRGTLDKLGVTPRMDHRWEYKNAMNVFTEKDFTPAHREATTSVVESLYGQMVSGIAAGRGLKEEEVRALVDRGPFLGKEAVEAKLVDGVAYRDEAYAKAMAKAGPGTKRLFLREYRRRAGALHRTGQTVALIYGVGLVTRGKSAFDPLSGESTLGSDTVAAAFRDAVRDKSVKAILFRVDSPGGSYVASDTIWRETVQAREAGKPVVVSMGNLAGSGGYFVSMAADRIVAEPGTITASIGVLGGKMLTSGFWQKLGLNWDEIHEGAHATFWSSIRDYSPAEWTRFEAWLDRVYDDFTSKVADGRHLKKERVLEIAKGRIWTGEQAKGLGLVDELGGMATALALAKKEAGIPEGQDVKLVVFPHPKSLLEQLLERHRENSGSVGTETALRTLEAVRPLVRKLDAAGLREDTGALTMPPLVLQP